MAMKRTRLGTLVLITAAAARQDQEDVGGLRSGGDNTRYKVPQPQIVD